MYRRRLRMVSIRDDLRSSSLVPSTTSARTDNASQLDPKLFLQEPATARRTSISGHLGTA